MLKNYNIGGFSSSPLSSIMPRKPLLQQSLIDTFSQPNQQLFGAESMPDYSQNFLDWSSPISNQIQFQAGLATQNSSNPLIAINGQNMINGSVSQMNTDFTNSTTPAPSIDYLGAGFKAMNTLGDKIGGRAGQVISDLGSLGSFIKMARDAKKGLKDGLNATKMSKAGSVGAAIGAASDLLGSFLPQKSEYDGPKGDITQTADQVYDGISDAAMAFGPVGMLVGGIMKGGSLLGKGLNAIGGGTDGMTTTDAILGSSFLNITPIGLINGFGGSKANTITKDTTALETVGSSYTGSMSTIDDALSKSGKKYGLFSQRAKNKANELIADARGQQFIMSNIADEANKRFAIQNAMSAINSNRYGLKLQGGYNQSSVRLGKSGLKIENIDKAKSLLDKYNKQQTNQLQEGGTLDPFEHYLQSLPENQRNSSDFRVKDYWIFNRKPKDFKEACKKGMFTLHDDGWHANTIAWNPETGEGEFMKSPQHSSIQKELDWYYSDAGAEFREDYELVKSSPYWKYVKRKKKEIPSHKEGGTFIELSIKKTSIKLTEPILESQDEQVITDSSANPINEFKEGGIIEDSTIKETFIELINPEDDIEEISTESMNSIEDTSIELINPMSIPEFQNGGQIIKSRTLAELIDYAKKANPRFIQRMSEPLKYVEWDDENGHHFGTHELGYTEIDGKYFIYPKIQETSNGDLIRYPSDKWKEAVDNAYKNKNGLFFNTEEEAKLFTESGENPDGTFYGYKLGWPEFFKQSLINKHQNGGSINVIPDGALHARKHNMDMQGITKKGIPVVSETETGKVEQHAEIEKEELIMRLEVTQKLEELEKKFYSEEATKEEKDQYALDAGKLLVKEILYNTQDNTNKLL